MINFDEQINDAIRNLLNYFKKYDREIKSEPKILQGAHPIIKLGEVKNLRYSHIDLVGKKTDRFKPINKSQQIGFNEMDYEHVISAAEKVFEIPEFNKYASLDFIEEAIFEWVVQKNGDDAFNEQPLTYFRRHLDDKIEEYIFYFPLVAIEIEKNFEIGNCHLVCFDEYFKQNEHEKFERGTSEFTEEDFNYVISRLENRIVLIACATGILERAEKEAKYKADLALSLFKSFLIDESVNPYTTICELEYKSITLPKYSLFYQTSNPHFDLGSGIRSNEGVQPVEITSEILQRIYARGFPKLSHYLKNSMQTDFDGIINNTILRIGSYTSETNIHERIVKIVSVFESVFLPKKKGKGKGLSIMKQKVLPRIISEIDLERGISLFIEHYNIRDKYIHNRIELRVNRDRLFEFQHIPIILLDKLLLYRKDCKTEEDLIKLFEL
ncbi:hypothetical protein F8C76_10225 [Flagellimonas olearia]|uniref:Apea-like HEPN domain-containing protein n=1 Tax=Flagellimonas olearia TaxID=552546 RepID=A0A6I1DU73_9FLAO|nr:hypothetical protein [Allomuricauda olearia]KAB7528238.1 hypothetical protein F8C76_10225 [Allomuricauda olearia]